MLSAEAPQNRPYERYERNPMKHTAPITLVTGASRGIGAATARRLAKLGHAVVVNYTRDAASANALVDELKRGGAQALAVQADVAIEADVLRLFGACDEAFGPLTGLVNNAGIVDSLARLDEMSGERFHRMMAVNVVGSLLCAREAVLRMSTRHGGRGGAIVNVSSVAARLGAPNNFIDYAASKGAIDTLTLGLSKEVAGEGIRVNAVRPGIIDTEIHAAAGVPDRAEAMASQIPIQRAGRADEVASVIEWLLSEGASYTTGALIDVAGGR
ncbi:MAG: sugar dehydrogenase [Rhizobacter sp.]|nr:sugar dehydrogenase [Rhizobacter sp.]